jgi:fluoride exporter
MMQAIWVGLFGVLGVLSRWSLDSLTGRWFEIFPIGILLINVLGSLLAGVIYVAGTEKGLLSPAIAVGLLVGFCGGFTTFSAYSLQAFLYLERADLFRGLGYLFISPLLGLAGVYLGVICGRNWLAA